MPPSPTTGLPHPAWDHRELVGPAPFGGGALVPGRNHPLVELLLRRSVDDLLPIRPMRRYVGLPGSVEHQPQLDALGGRKVALVGPAVVELQIREFQAETQGQAPGLLIDPV